MRDYYDDPIRCEECDVMIDMGEDYYEYDGVALCSEDCIKDHSYRKIELQVEIKHIDTPAEARERFLDSISWEANK